MKFALRAVTPSDLNALATFVSEYYTLDGLFYNDRLARQALLELMAENQLGQIWFLELAEQPIGYLILTFGFTVEFHGKHAVIGEVYLRPGYRGRGYFRKALTFVESHCRRLKI